MGSIVDFYNQPRVYGVDTETYNTGSECGLISIQVSDGSGTDYYFSSDDFSQSEEQIRNEICEKFFAWIETLKVDVTLAFFNLDYDGSQFLKFLVSHYRYLQNTNHSKVAKGCFRVIESDRTMYKIALCNRNGCHIRMLDIAKFLTATNLDTACAEWLGEHKQILNHEQSDDWIQQCLNDMKVKTFPKAQATKEQQSYAIKDASLTARLFNKLVESEVIEPDRYITIAGRTMGHFQQYLKSQWRVDFNRWAYGVKDAEIVDACVAKNERLMRPSLRGGICRANRTGVFENAHHLDAKSHYPSQMYKPRIPFGAILDDKPNCAYERLLFPKGYLVLKPNKLPYLQWRNHLQCSRYAFVTDYEPGEYCQNAYLDGSYMFWGFEWDLILDCYDFVQLEEPTTYYIEMAKNDVLAPYIGALYEGKSNNTGTKKYYFKILLNSLYGKFLSNPDGISIDYSTGERVKVEEHDMKTYYLPLGSWVACGGRVDLMRAMLSLPCEDVLYCDTDSIIYKGDRKPNVSIGKNLGQWDIEHENVTAYIVGAKTYQELLPNGQLITKCAGLSKSAIGYVPFGALKEGLEVPCLKSHRDPENWAISLRATTFKVNTRATVLR